MTPPPTVLHWPGGGSWDPSQLSSLAAWYKADAITGLSDGDPVSTWSDESASGWDATASSTDRPTYKTSILNGLPVVRFNGTDHYLALGAVDASRNVSGSTIYAVLQTDVTAATFRCWWFTGIAGSTSSARTLANLSSVARIGGRTLDSDSFASVSVTTNVPVSSWVLHGGVFDNANGTMAQFVQASANGTASLGSSGTTSNTASSAVMIGTNGNASSTAFFDGDIAEIVFAHQALGTTDREKLEGYLAHKWGLTANLPSSHPYKSIAP